MWQWTGGPHAPVPVRKRRQIASEGKDGQGWPVETRALFSSIFFSFSFFFPSGVSKFGVHRRSNYRARNATFADVTRNHTQPSRHVKFEHKPQYPCLGSPSQGDQDALLWAIEILNPGPGLRTFGDREVWAVARAVWFVTQQKVVITHI